MFKLHSTITLSPCLGRLDSFFGYSVCWVLYLQLESLGKLLEMILKIQIKIQNRGSNGQRNILNGMKMSIAKKQGQRFTKQKATYNHHSTRDDN